MDLEGSISDVQIDEQNLDRECIRLPTQYLQWAHKSADAKRDADDRKNQLEVIDAELSKEIRADPSSFGLEKVTEASIASIILTNPRYQKAVARLNNAKHQADLTQAVVWALEHKKRTLTLLVELHGMGYFSNPKVSERGREAVENMTKRKVRRLRDD